MAKKLWQPGQSGNPNGRPRQKPFIDWCKVWAEEKGKDQLIKIAENSRHRGQLDAIKTIFAYGVGKPVETQILDAEIAPSVGSSIEDLAGEIEGVITGAKNSGVGADSQNQVDAGK